MDGLSWSRPAPELFYEDFTSAEWMGEIGNRQRFRQTRRLHIAAGRVKAKKLFNIERLKQ
jgi:hypothetical protein